jgi:hypothetical protein
MKHVNLRLDEDLHAQIKQRAEQEDRSLQQQLVYLLKLGLLYGRLSQDAPNAAINRFYRTKEADQR